MKSKHLLLLSMCCLLLMACGKDDGPTTLLSQTDFPNVSYEDNNLTLNIQTEGKWTATSMVRWCRVWPEQGEGNGSVTIQVDANLDVARIGKVVIWTEEKQFDVSINQGEIPAGQEYHYRLPIIFHVFYANANDSRQYISATRIHEVLGEANRSFSGNTRYNGGENATDMNLEFVLATEDENGRQLETPGVEYIQVDRMPIDCEAFMGDQRYVKYLWDPNKYINVMLYNFADVEGGIILGISHLPLSTAGNNYLEGLGKIEESYLTKDNLPYPQCVSLNSLYFYEKTTDAYNSMDAGVTATHELGHYLGLHHAFDEDASGNLSVKCIDSDYCNDTPSYNRNSYLANLRALIYEAQSKGEPVEMSEAVKRENCQTGQTFSSYNIMDYEVTYADRFTADQRKRIRNVLTYSPLIPGPKKGAPLPVQPL